MQKKDFGMVMFAIIIGCYLFIIGSVILNQQIAESLGNFSGGAYFLMTMSFFIIVAVFMRLLLKNY